MRLFSRYILKFSGAVAILGTLIGVAGGYYSVRLYKNLKTNFEELLPTSSRSVTDLNEVKRRLSSIDSLAILMFSDDAKASKRFVLDLVKRLETLKPRIASSIEYQIGPELRFFKERQALYVDLEDLKKIRSYIEDKINYETDLYNPLNIFSGVDIPEPRLDFLNLRDKYTSSLANYERLPGGFYATQDEKVRTVLVYMAGESSNVDMDFELKAAVEKIIGELKPQSYAKDLNIRYTGGVQNTIEEHEALIEDLELSTVIVMIVVTLAMIVFFRNVRGTLALMGSLVWGTLWTFGASYFAVGYLNANSAFLGAIVLGNGINFGIIVLARYVEERRLGKGNDRAILISLRQTATATATAALGAGLAYGSLMLTSFRGFNQFGVIGLIGMVLCWLSAFTLLPAFLTVLDRIGMLRFKRLPPGEAHSGLITRGVVWLIERASVPVAIIAVVAVTASFATLGKYKPDILETNLRNLRNKVSLEKGSGYLGTYLDQIFQRWMSPLVILPKTVEESDRIAAILKEHKQQQGKDSLIASVQTMRDFVPKQQEEKIAVIREIRALLTPRILSRLSDADRKQVSTFLTDAILKPITARDLPEMVVSKFTEKDGSVGKLVLIEPPLDGSMDRGDRVMAFVQELRTVADSVSPGAAVAGSLTITADMVEAISKDGPKATLFAFLAVVGLVIILFRNVKTIGLITFSLLLGVLWLAGIILGFWIKINFLNFIALPITFGIGVDYGVNIFQRYREEGPQKLLSVIRQTGGAVMLCSFSTIVGYGSLLIAGNQGFVSFGTLAVAGEITCVIAAVIALPAFLRLYHQRRQARSARDPQ